MLRPSFGGAFLRFILIFVLLSVVQILLETYFNLGQSLIASIAIMFLAGWGGAKKFGADNQRGMHRDERLSFAIFGAIIVAVLYTILIYAFLVYAVGGPDPDAIKQLWQDSTGYEENETVWLSIIAVMFTAVFTYFGAGFGNRPVN